jgi:hypothetical protein
MNVQFNLGHDMKGGREHIAYGGGTDNGGHWER